MRTRLLESRGVIVAAALALASSCGGTSDAGTTTPPPGGGTPTISSVAVTPASFNLVVGDTQRFSATAFVAGGATTPATFAWGATGGTVTTAGLFTSGPGAGAAKVWATASSKSDTARGTVAAAGGSAQVDTIFSEGFESGSFASWDDRGLPGNQSIVTTQAHSGTRALEVTYPSGSDGGWLTKFFMPGFDSAYASYWVRFPTGWQSGTKLISFYGSRTDNQWSATGKAGVCPTGTDFFAVDIVQEFTANPGPTRFYTYYPGIPQTPAGSGTCYGTNGLAAGAVYSPPLEVLPGTWHHVEYWVVLNTPGSTNSTQRFCIDGVVRGVWSGIAIRTSTILRLNAVTLTNSMALGSPVTQKMWADDLLVTRQRPAGAC